ncbi:MAG: cupin domain-containing protein [Planctomycetota bacterium]
MKLRRMRSHPDFKLEGRSLHFQSFWELELTPGEATSPHQHYESEELIYMLDGEGTVTIASLERPLTPGEIALVPPRTDHVISNLGRTVVKAITVESRFDLGVEPGAEGEVCPTKLEDAEREARRTVATIEGLVEALPRYVDEASAIQSIVSLFDIGGNLSEKIEAELGLDNAAGLEALGQVERRIMGAVLEICTRYKRRSGRWLLDS